jgi:hypothetical protein
MHALEYVAIKGQVRCERVIPALFYLAGTLKRLHIWYWWCRCQVSDKLMEFTVLEEVVVDVDLLFLDLVDMVYPSAADFAPKPLPRTLQRLFLYNVISLVAEFLTGSDASLFNWLLVLLLNSIHVCRCAIYKMDEAAIEAMIVRYRNHGIDFVVCDGPHSADRCDIPVYDPEHLRWFENGYEFLL